MVTTPICLEEDLLYPSSDGQPMAENTKQYEWIVLIKENLEILYQNHADVFIAGDLLWYPVEVSTPPAPCQAPDVMVVLGRPKGHRPSYQQWKENNIAPQIAFEILSQSNRTAKGRAQMLAKLDFYQRYGIEEYYIYDPDRLTLVGYVRSASPTLDLIPNMSNWVSPLLNIRFDWRPGRDLVLLGPGGDRFLSPLELDAKVRRLELIAQNAKLQVENAELRVETAEFRAEAAEFRIGNAELRAENAELRIETAELRAETAEFRAETAELQLVGVQRQNAQRLLALGISIAQIAEVLNLSIDDLRDLE
jgi:Uma2 family endonuclease